MRHHIGTGHRNTQAAALAWLADTSNDTDKANTLEVWAAMCAAAGVEWPKRGRKAERIEKVRRDLRVPREV